MQSTECGLKEIWRTGTSLPRLTQSEWWMQLVVQAWRGLSSSPMTTVLTIATVTVSLALFAAFLLWVENFRDLLSSSRTNFTMSVFLQEGVAAEKRDELRTALTAEPSVVKVQYRSKLDALEEFKRALGSHASMVEGLEQDNPLPESLEVSFKEKELSEDLFREFQKRYSARPEVLEVQYSAGSLSQIASLLRLFKGVGLAAIFVMFVMTGFIIANTIKLAVFAYREEVAIMLLVGAPERQVKAPFVIQGFIQGAAGVVASVALLYLAYVPLSAAVRESQVLSLILTEFHFLSFASLVLVTLTGIGVGVAAGLFAVQRAMGHEGVRG